MKKTRFLVRAGLCLTTLALIGAALLSPGQRSYALPAFARKYNISCAQCHTVVPRLTTFGYAFQRAGYRLKIEDQKISSLANAVSFMAEGSLQNTNPSGNSGFDLGEVEVQFASSLGKRLSSMVMYEFNVEPGESNFDQVWLQYNAGTISKFWTFRLGQIPVLSGIRQGVTHNITFTEPMILGPVGPLEAGEEAESRAFRGLFRRSPMRSRARTRSNAGEEENEGGNFALDGLERGLEVGYTRGGFTARASWLNGIDETGSGTSGLSGRRGNDYVLQGEYIFDKTGTVLSGFYYNGKTPLTTAGYNNFFSRGGLFASKIWYLKPREPYIPDLALELHGGVMWGADRMSADGTTARSTGNLLELTCYARNRTAYLLRYDSIKPSSAFGSSLNRTTEAYTIGIAHQSNDYTRLSLEFRKQRNPGSDAVIAGLWFYY